MMKILAFVPIVLLLIFSAGCSSMTIEGRKDLARRIAEGASMSARIYRTRHFKIQSYERIDDKKSSLHVYIEGDGLAWLNKHQPSLDPTPTNPVALKLAAQDQAPNVIYLARPCQYLRSSNCETAYWTNARFSPLMLKTYQEVLDQIKLSRPDMKFELIGYSGGGAMAALLAANRNDVLSIRTVAGNLDTSLFASIHKVAPMRNSLNPKDQADKLAALPQLHFIGARDKIISPLLAESFVNAQLSRSCAQIKVVSLADHEMNWISSWPDLLAAGPSCQTHIVN